MNPRLYLLLPAALTCSILAQEPSGLDLQIYAGLSIAGPIGAVYSVEYSNDVTKSNDWRCLEFLQLPATTLLWVDQTAPATEKRFYRVVSSAQTNLVFIPPGRFRMGSPTNEVGRNPSVLDTDDEGPQTEVTTSRGFFMGKFEVTQGDYLAVMGSNPSQFTGNANRPVDTVTWFNATNYCGKLTQRERAAARISANSLYRLPTEAEWEFACRALTSTRFSYADDPDYAEAGNYIWYEDNSNSSTQPVGQKLPNPWGLYDMHGNIGEWCQDWYGLHSGGVALDPEGPATGATRVSKGGLWFRPASFCRSAFRLGISPDFSSDGTGFRVVLVPGLP